MDLVEQYLRAVAALLPKSQREDIVAELRDIALSRIEAREADLGRKLTSDEIEAELREIGHPIVVAQRYREEPQHLIGPALYPYWMFGVKIAVTIQVVAALIVLIVRVIAGHDFGLALGRAVGQGLVGTMTMVGFATVAAFLVERGKINISRPERWRVRDLRFLEFVGWDLWDLRDHLNSSWGEQSRTPTAPKAVRRLRKAQSSAVAEGLAQIAFGGVFVLWWVGAIHFGVVGHSSDLRQLGLDASGFQGMSWNDVHQMLFAPLLAYGLAIIGRGVVMTANPMAMRLRGVIDIAMGLGFLLICGWLWTASPISPAIHADSVSEFVLGIGEAFRNSPPLALEPIIALWVAFGAFGAVCRVLKGVWELLVPQRAAMS